MRMEHYPIGQGPKYLVGQGISRKTRNLFAKILEQLWTESHHRSLLDSTRIVEDTDFLPKTVKSNYSFIATGMVKLKLRYD